MRSLGLIFAFQFWLALQQDKWESSWQEEQEYFKKMDVFWKEDFKDSVWEICLRSSWDEKEFGISTEFLSETCKVCGNGRPWTHRELMRELRPSWNSKLSWEFFENHLRLNRERHERREKWKLWKRIIPKRKITPEEQERELQKMLPMIRALFPEDWQAMIDAHRKQLKEENE